MSPLAQLAPASMRQGLPVGALRVVKAARLELSRIALGGPATGVSTFHPCRMPQPPNWQFLRASLYDHLLGQERRQWM